jgi:hypothetical protein
MIKFTNTIEINRSSHEVFDYLADLEHTPRWNWAIDSTRKISSGPIRVGTEYRQTRSVPQKATETLRITSYEPARLVAVEGTLGHFPARLTYELTGNGAGTMLTNTVELDPPPAFQIAGPLLSRRIRSSVAENLTVLKELLER